MTTTATSISRSVVDLRKDLSDLLSEVSFAGKRVNVTRNGKPVAVLVPTEDIERLEELELLLDGLALEKAIKEDDGEEFTLDELFSTVAE